MWQTIRRTIVICFIVYFVVAWFNAAVFFSYTMNLGGTAANGKVENGRYFVGDHGKYTEVTRKEFEFNKRYERLAKVMFVAAFPLGFIVRFGLMDKDGRIPSGGASVRR